MDKANIQAKIEETKELIRHIEYDLYKTRHQFSAELLQKGIVDLKQRLEKYQLELKTESLS